MKFLRNLLAFVALLSLMIVSSCRHDIDTYVPDNVYLGQTLYPSPVQASVNGIVLNENDEPVFGAVVSSGTHTTTTDARGLFRFEQIQMDKYAAVVSVTYNGYFKGLRTFSASDGSANFVKIRLTPKTLAGTVDATAGGAVTLPDGSVITLQPATVVIKSTGQVYNGTVNVFAVTIDPTLVNISQTIPGSFQALDKNNFRVTLQSFGMLAVQLESQSGELLQIATGKKSKITFYDSGPYCCSSTSYHCFVVDGRS